MKTEKKTRAAGNGKTIRTTCRTSDSLSLDQIVGFQGELKTLSDQDFAKLKGSILRYGISFPAFIWKSKKHNRCLDGHQRWRVLSVLKKNGYKIPRIPVVYVDAKNEKEAKEKVLLLSSQYGRYTMDSVYEFMETSDLDFGEMEQVMELPQIDLGRFRASYYDEPVAPDGFRSVGEDIEVEHVCPRCGFQFSGGKTIQMNRNESDPLVEK